MHAFLPGAAVLQGVVVGVFPVLSQPLRQLTLFDSIDKPLDYEKILKENIVWGTYGEVLTRLRLHEPSDIMALSQ